MTHSLALEISQVGWEIEGGTMCGRRGCCTTPESGARSWCPTTSPCGEQQKQSDICDLTGVAAVSERTCRPELSLKA